MLRITDTREVMAMTSYADSRAPTTTFLTRYFGGRLIDKGECCAVERFRAISNGEIRRWPARRCRNTTGAASRTSTHFSSPGPGAAPRIQRDHRLHGPRHTGPCPIPGVCHMRPVRRPHEATLTVRSLLYEPPCVQWCPPTFHGEQHGLLQSRPTVTFDRERSRRRNSERQAKGLCP